MRGTRNRLPLRRIAAGIVLAASAISAAPVSAIGLVEAYQAALRNDPNFQSAVHEYEGGQQYEKLGRSNLLPSVGYQISQSHVRSDVKQPNFLGQISESHPNYDSESQSLQLRQPIFSADAWARYKQGQAQTGVSNAVFDARKQELIVRVVGAYFDAQYAEYNLALVQAQRDFYAEQMRVNDRMFQKGEGTKTDMLETKARLDVAEAQLVEARDNVVVARNTLAGIIGQDVTVLDPLQDNFRVRPMQPATFEEWKAIALEKNPEIAAQKQTIEAQRQEVNKNRAGHLPRVDFVAGMSKGKSETINTLGTDQVARSVGFQMSIPIFSGFAVDASTKQAAAGLEKSKADLDAKSTQVLVELRKQFSQAQSSIAKIDALNKSVDSANLLVEATRQSIRGGVRINLDLLNAQQQLYSAKRDLAQARYNYLLSFLRLRSAAGTLTTEDVDTVASFFTRGGGRDPLASLDAGTATGASAQAAGPVAGVESMPTARYASALVRGSSGDSAVQAAVATARADDKAATAGAGKEQVAGTQEELLQTVAAWTRAWSSKDVDAYLGFYAPDFRPPGGKSRDAWAGERRQRIAAKRSIAVQAEAPEVTVKGDVATVSFRQRYRADSLSEETRKTLEFVKRDGRWQIRNEAAG